MGYVISLIFVIIVVFGAVVAVHLRPLNEEEIEILARKRRNKEILQYFSFATVRFSVNMDFKKSMNPKGQLYQVDESLSAFPSFAAALLKYKKHEWFIIGFEKNRRVNSMWVNKGPDRSTVFLPRLDTYEYLRELAKANKQTSVLRFHNHPNENYYPSDPDVQSASSWAQDLNSQGINFLDFVCSKGMHNFYYLSPADSFLPLSEFIDAINKVNGVSRSKNLSLHYERIFGH